MPQVHLLIAGSLPLNSIKDFEHFIRHTGGSWKKIEYVRQNPVK